jgi:hypothetical protein
VAELPRDVIALEWGYEANHPFDQHGALFANSGVPFYVCPGTSSWNNIAGRTDNAIGNLRNAAENGLNHGAIGVLNTDWGDNGHWQPLPVSYLGFAYGAAVSWAYEANRDLDLSQAISRYAFHDSSGTMGQLAYDLGNVYQEAGLIPLNASALFRLLQLSPDELDNLDEFGNLRGRSQDSRGLSQEQLQHTNDQIDQIMARLADADMQRPDADLIRREFNWAADMLRHACQRGVWMLGQKTAGGRQATVGGQWSVAVSLTQEADRLIAEYRDIWLARNRPGGFRESVARMEKMKQDYAAS